MKYFKMKLAVLGLAAGVAMAPIVQAYQIGELFPEQQAVYGATHFVKIDFTDLTTSATNTAQVFTNIFPIVAKMGVQVVAMVLDRPFDSGNTNYTGSTLFQIGDSASSNLFLDTTELNVDGTEVFLKYGRGAETPGTTVTYTNITALTTITRTNLIGFTTTTNTTNACLSGFTGVFQTQTIVSAISAQETQTVVSVVSTNFGYKIYTTNDFLRFRFQPNAEEAVNAYSNGALRIFIRVRDALHPDFP